MSTTLMYSQRFFILMMIFWWSYNAFEDYDIKPETGKLIVFSNSIYKHYVTEVEGQ